MSNNSSSQSASSSSSSSSSDSSESSSHDAIVVRTTSDRVERKDDTPSRMSDVSEDVMDSEDVDDRTRIIVSSTTNRGMDYK